MFAQTEASYRNFNKIKGAPNELLTILDKTLLVLIGKFCVHNIQRYT